MSRMSLSSFLSKAKYTLSQSIKGAGDSHTSFVIGNSSADLDSIACAILYGYLKSSTPAARKADHYLIPVTNIPSAELRLRPELTALLKHANLQPSDLITLDHLGNLPDKLPPNATSWTLVDHNALQGTLGTHYSSRIVGVIDHHEDENVIPTTASPRIIETSGSCTSLVVNHLRESWQSLSSSASTSGYPHGQADIAWDDAAYTSGWDAQLAKLALGAILIDTANLKNENKTTEHDRKAVRFVEAKINLSMRIGKGYERDRFFQELQDAKVNLDGLSVEELLWKDYKEWTEGGLKLGISVCVRSISYLLAKETNLLPVLARFVEKKGLDLFALMTAHTEEGEFERQLLLLAVEDGKAVEAAEKCAKSIESELQLVPSDMDIGKADVKWWRLWQQKKLAASRKQVAPLLRDAMR